MSKTKNTTTPTYIATLLHPRPEKATDRRAWSIPVFGVWVPFFTATNTEGQTHISAETLGAPVRLARDSDGSVKFSKSGRPVLKLVKELGDQVKLVRDNFTAGLVSYAEGVLRANPDGYKAQAENARKKGEAIYKLEAKLLVPAEAEAPAEPAEGDGKPAEAPEPVAVTA